MLVKERSTWFAVMLLFLAASTALAQTSSGGGATITLLSADAVSADPNQTLSEPFSAKIADAEGNPVAGVTVWFFVNFPLCAPLRPCDLPPASLYGHFTDAKQSVVAISDQNGVVTSPLFTAGSSPGSYQIAIQAGAADGENLKILGPNFVYLSAFVNVSQNDPGNALLMAPVLSNWMLVFLSACMLFCVKIHSRRFFH